jgi:hypothetical protein
VFVSQLAARDAAAAGIRSGGGGGGGGGGIRGDLGSIAGVTDMMVARRFTRNLPTFPSGTTASAGPKPIPPEYTADWGGAPEQGRDSYYITEESREAKLGSSLDWLLQLDGDNLRNAFLNAPWVKAVILIRIGKEREALEWLSQAHVEGSDGLDAAYVPPENSPATGTPPATVRDALNVLIDKIHEFDAKSRTPIEAGGSDPDGSKAYFEGSLPTEAVFENGFYPLKGGVRFDGDPTEQTIISQWMEILPTDQVAALEVEYDPKTLRVREPPEQP